MRKDTRPLLAVTMGDPAGVGPEVAVGALARREVQEACRALVIGDARVLRRAADWVGSPFLPQVVSSAGEAEEHGDGVCLLDLGNADPEAIALGQVSAEAGRAAAEYITRAAQLARIGAVAAVVTGPINKESLRLAGVPYPGHTELFAALAETPEARSGARHGHARVAMMLVHGNMRVAHVTTHAAVRNACEMVTREQVLSVIRLTQQALLKMGVSEPRIAVAGLNPHAGESGLFGDEELREIAPAVSDAARLGIRATGPLPPDTVFARHRAGEFDAVVAMLHDHGHIAVKTVGFAPDATGRLRTAGVNVTLGLPFIRTSADHGTAFDIAGKGIADPTSMVEAILLAAQMAKTQA